MAYEMKPILLFMVLLLGLTAGCGDSKPTEAPLRPNIVVYCIDTLRADHLGCYGYEKDTSPFIDSIAGNGIIFDNAVSQAPWTAPSVASYITSTYPSTHRVLKGGRQISEEAVTMAEFLADAGYWTAGFIQNAYAGSVIAADRGYKELMEITGEEGGEDHETRKQLRNVQGPQNWIENWKGYSPFFLYIHTTEPHGPYKTAHNGPFGGLTPEDSGTLNDLLKDFRKLTRKGKKEDEAGTAARQAELKRISDLLARDVEKVTHLYNNEVRRADENVKKVVKALKKADLWSNTLFILLSDHGQEIYDHGYWQHDQSLYQELVHVPLIMKLPRGAGRGTRIAEPVQLVDVLPTIAGMINEPPKPFWEGRSVVPLLQGKERADAAVYSERINLGKHDPSIIEERGNIETSMIRDGMKAILHREVDRISLYDIIQDPEERIDLAPKKPQKAKKLREELEAWLDRRKPLKGIVETDLTKEQLESLRALGYLR
jgi:arylsulfatase A-like enzyme